MEKTVQEMIKLGFEFHKPEESKEGAYVKIPKQFYRCSFYRKYLNSNARELYAFLKDRMNLSELEKNRENFTDAKTGFIYLVFTREEAMETFGFSKATCTEAFKALNRTGLIFEKRQGQGLNNLIFIGKVRYMSEEESSKLIEVVDKMIEIEKEEKENKKSKNQTSRSLDNTEIQKSKNQTSGSSDFKLQKVYNLDGIKTDPINPDPIKPDGEEEEGINIGSRKDIYTFYANAKDRKLTNVEKSKLKSLLEAYPEEIMIKAIDVMIERAEVINYRYLFKTLQDWRNKNLNTAEEVDKHFYNEEVKNEKIKIDNQKKKDKRAKAIDKPSGSTEKKLNFTDYPQREYDYDELEKKLLGWE